MTCQTYAKLCLDSRMMERLSQRAQSERKGALTFSVKRVSIFQACIVEKPVSNQPWA